MRGAQPRAIITGPLMTVDEACVFLRFVGANGSPDRRRFYDWKRHHRPKSYQLGRSLRFTQEDLEACLVVIERPTLSLVRSMGGAR